MAVARGFEELEPAVAFEFLLQGEGLADLTIFDLHELVVHISTGVAFAKDLKGLFVLALGDEVAGRLGNEPACVSLKTSSKDGVMANQIAIS